MNILDISMCILVLGAVLFLIFLLPIWLLLTGVRRKGKLRIVVGMIWLVASCGLVAFSVDQSSTRHERILDHGKTPDGREYVLFQVRTGEPYDVRLYIRNAEGEWRFYYVDPEARPWRHGGRVDFSDGKARVFCGDELSRTIDLAWYDKVPVRDAYPAEMTAEEVYTSRRYCRNRKAQSK